MMGSICAEQQHHKFHHLTKKPSPVREIDIPPRKKLLARRLSPSAESFAAAMDSPNAEASAIFSRFLPCNNNPDSDSDEDDPYSSDHFRIYEFKIRKCNRSRSHDWTDCPFAHPGEKARRRDPRRFRYSGTVCPDFRKGNCVRGDGCDFSHGVFECWLHPSRYRTEACKDGKHCKRKVCFFAHSSRQLRIVPENPPSPPPPPAERKSTDLNYNRNCCLFCRPITASPTSTLMDCMLSQLSPPASPIFSPFDRRRAGLHEFVSASGLSYEEALAELMASYEAMSLVEAARPAPRKLFRGGFSGGRNLMDDERYNTVGGSSSSGPDLGWVNDLLT